MVLPKTWNQKTMTWTAQNTRPEKTRTGRRTEVRSSRAAVLAELLASRLAAHAYCDTHTESAADPDNCPYCADRAAYTAWLAQGGEDFRDQGSGRPIALEDIWAQPLTEPHAKET